MVHPKLWVEASTIVDHHLDRETIPVFKAENQIKECVNVHSIETRDTLIQSQSLLNDMVPNKSFQPVVQSQSLLNDKLPNKSFQPVVQSQSLLNDKLPNKSFQFKPIQRVEDLADLKNSHYIEPPATVIQSESRLNDEKVKLPNKPLQPIQIEAFKYTTESTNSLEPSKGDSLLNPLSNRTEIISSAEEEEESLMPEIELCGPDSEDDI
jgi:hypothetical protein